MRQKQTVKDFVWGRLDEQEAEYGYRRREVIINGKALNLDNQIIDWYIEDVGFGKEKLAAALQAWCTLREMEIVGNHRSKALIRPGDGLDRGDFIQYGRWELARFLRACCGENANELTYYVLLHWLWQVKRKLLDLHVDNHMMIVLYGKSGGGKSEAIRKLLEPYYELSANLGLSALTDSREAQIFNRTYIGFLDEMHEAAGKKANVEAIKRVVTETDMHHRPLHSNTHQVIDQKTTFIGASNVPITDIVKDKTSGRRFWEIRCQDLLDWAEINTIDYELLWCAVDGENLSPLEGSSLIAVQSAQQKKLRVRPEYEHFLEECYDYDEAADTIETGTLGKDLYYTWEAWANENKVQRSKDETLRSTLTQIGRSAKVLWPGFQKVRTGNGDREWIWPLKSKQEEEIPDEQD